MRQIKVGRSQRHCDVVVADSSVSSVHLELCVGDDGVCSIVDAKSSNGTFVLAQGKRTRVNEAQLSLDDALWLGPYETTPRKLLAQVQMATIGSASDNSPGRDAQVASDNSPSMSAQYDAFISYSRTDNDFVRTLESKLKRFRLPKLPGFKKRRFQIFRDEEDLVGSSYFDSIESYLRDSRKLLLICSPGSAKSEFVDDEVRRFVALRGASNVIPVLLDGIANNEAGPKDGERLAFPPSLVELVEMPLAISYLAFDTSRDKIDQGEFEGAWYTVLASLVDLSRAEVEQRERKRRRGVIRNVVLGLSVLSIALGGLALYARGQQSIAEEQRQLAQEQQEIAEVQRNIAQERAQVAVSRQLASRSENLGEEDPDTAMLLAAQAYGFRDTLEARQALFRRADFSADIDVILHGYVRALTATMDPGGQRIAAGGRDATVLLWDRGTADKPKVLAGDGTWVEALAISADGKMLASVGSMSGMPVLAVRDLQTDRHVLIPDVEGWDLVIALSPDGGSLLWSSSERGEIVIWDTKRQAREKVIASGGNISSMAFHPDGELLAVAGGDSPQVRVVDLNGKSRPSLTFPALISRVQFSPDGRTLAARSGALVYFMDLENAAVFDRVDLSKLSWLEDGNDAAVDEITFAFESRGGLVALGPGERTVIVSNPYWPRRPSATETERGGDHSDRVLALSADGRFVVRGQDVRRLDTDELLLRLPEATRVDGSRAFAFGGGGTTLAFSSHDGSSEIWLSRPITTGNSVLFKRGEDPIDHLSVSEDGSLLAAAKRRGPDLDALNPHHDLRVWRIEDGARVELAKGPDAHYMSMSFSPDGKWLAAGSNVGVSLWNIQTGQLKTVLERPVGAAGASPIVGVVGLAFSTDSRTLAVADDLVTVWDLQSLSVVTSLGRRQSITAMLGSGGVAGIGSLAFDPKGKFLATSSQGNAGETLVWDLGSGEVVSKLHEIEGWGGYLVYRNAGAEIVYADVIMPVRVIDMEPKSLIAEICRKAGRGLLEPEWKRYVGSVPYEPNCRGTRSNTGPVVGQDIGLEACRGRPFQRRRGCLLSGGG